MQAGTLAPWIRAFSLKLKLSLYRLVGLSARAESRLDLYLTRRAFRKMYGRDPDLKNPVLFGEKMVARKLYDRRPVLRILADKLLVRDFVSERIGSQYLPRLFQVCERFEDIDFEALPQKFVIKPNHGCRFNVLVDDKRSLDRTEAARQIHHYMGIDYYDMSREWPYKGIVRRILIEEFLEESPGKPITDFRISVFDGVPKLIQVSCRQTTHGERVAAFYDTDCKRLPMRLLLPSGPNGPVSGDPPGFSFPANVAEMLDLAARLGRGFDFMRVDLYAPGGKVIFGEMTSMAGGGVRPFDPPEYERMFGDCWNLALS